MRYNNVSLEVHVRGRQITEYPHNGQVFVEGRPGSRYEIVVRNHNLFPIEAIVSVDGLSVIDGKDAGPNSSGYLVDPGASITIPGWKVDSATAASFEFAGKGKSYAQFASGSTRNVGVIGLLAYKLQHPIYTTVPHPLRSIQTQPLPGWIYADGYQDGVATYSASGCVSYGASITACCVHDAGEVSMQNLGTAFGQATDFATISMEAKREDLLGMIVIHYDDARGLKARGISLDKRPRVRNQPNPFPGMSGCKPPPCWNG